MNTELQAHIHGKTGLCRNIISCMILMSKKIKYINLYIYIYYMNIYVKLCPYVIGYLTTEYNRKLWLCLSMRSNHISPSGGACVTLCVGAAGQLR